MNILAEVKHRFLKHAKSAMLITAALVALGLILSPKAQSDISTGRESTITIAAYNAPAHVKAEADYVLDGYYDEVKINAAIAALPTTNYPAGIWGGGRIKISGGDVLIYGPITQNKDNVVIEGENLGATIIWALAPMENSLLWTGNYGSLRELKIIGNGYASQVHIQGAYTSLYRVSIAYHTTYNILFDNGSALTIDQSRFAGKPIKSTQNHFTISNSIMSGIGEDENLLVGGNRIAIIENHFDQFAGNSIKIIGETHGLKIENNWWNTTAVAESLIDDWNSGYGIIGGTITGNSQNVLPNTSYFLKALYANELVVEGNYILKPIYIDSIAGSFRIRSLEGYIQYNGQTNLMYVEKYQGGARILRLSAPPTSGTWSVNDTVWNTAPAIGQPIGWVNVEAGTPGVWASMGNVGE